MNATTDVEKEQRSNLCCVQDGADKVFTEFWSITVSSIYASDRVNLWLVGVPSQVYFENECAEASIP